jgi:hypothetical protein
MITLIKIDKVAFWRVSQGSFLKASNSLRDWAPAPPPTKNRLFLFSFLPKPIFIKSHNSDKSESAYISLSLLLKARVPTSAKSSQGTFSTRGDPSNEPFFSKIYTSYSKL